MSLFPGCCYPEALPAKSSRHGAVDNMVLTTLLASKADFLVTGDQDLLVLANEYRIVAPANFAYRIF